MSDEYARGQRDGLRLALAVLAAEEEKWAALLGGKRRVADEPDARGAAQVPAGGPETRSNGAQPARVEGAHVDRRGDCGGAGEGRAVKQAPCRIEAPQDDRRNVGRHRS